MTALEAVCGEDNRTRGSVGEDDCTRGSSVERHGIQTTLEVAP